jgi:chromatin assembly factor 1 subunit A
MPRTPRKKEIKKVEIIEDVKEPEPEPETEQAPKDDAKNDAYYYSKDKTPEPEQHPSTDEELEIPKKRPKQRSEKQLEQLKLARETALLNKETKRKQKEEEEKAVKKELESKIQAEKKAIEEKIVKKALSIKKKEIKKQEILDEISDDETPIEKIKIPIKKEPNLKVKTNKTLYFD